MSLLDLLTGGKSQDADAALNEALQQYQNVPTPTVEQLTLPQLQQYVQAGIMTPEQATAYLQKSNAYDDIQTDPKTTEAEMTALSQLQGVAADNGMTPEMRAQLTSALNTANTNTQGERGSITDALAQRGVSSSLFGPATQMAASGQDAQTANLAGTQAAGQAEQNALTAMTNSGTLAGNINNQEYQQAAQKAAAANAIAQWNAENQTQNSQFNTTNANAAQTANLANAQNISNTNTQNANARTGYNANLPQTVYNDQMQKAAGMAGINTQQASQATAQGNQNMGIYGAALNLAAPQPFTGQSAGSTLSGQSGGGGGGSVPAGAGGAMMGGGSAGAGAAGGAGAADSAILLASTGGDVPGRPTVPGDSLKNDKVHALLSPGEVVVPRTIASNPGRVKQFVSHLIKQPKPIKPMHPADLHAMMEALSARREPA